MITSASNGRIKYVKDLLEKSRLRRKDACFVAEGVKMFLEAPDDRIKEVYVMESFMETSGKCSGSFGDRYEEVEQKLDKTNYEIVADSVFKKISDTVTPQGIITVVNTANSDINDVVKGDKPLIMVLENIQDPGNMGTIIRTAEGAGVSGILLTRDCVDIYNPKVIRSTMGSIYRSVFSYVDSTADVLSVLASKNIKTYAAALNSEAKCYYEYEYTNGSAFIIGNEGNGLKEETVNMSDNVCYIPMSGQVESLNASVAASILMYEAKRQRGN